MIGGKFVARALAAAALALSALAASPAGVRAQEGRWGPLVGLPVVPTSAAVLKNGKVLFWSADGEFSFTSVGQVYAALYDPTTGVIERRFAQLGHNMFCTGTTLLSDGRVFVNGGSNAERVSIYDPLADTFTRGDDMWLPRGYNANTILQDGSVLTMGGSWAGPGEMRKDGEIWTPGQGWRKPSGLTVAGMQSTTITDFSKDSHFALIPTGNGRVLYAAPGPMMQWIDTTGSGRVTDAGRRGDDTFASSGNALMYDTGKILKTGGSQQYTGAAASAAAYDIDVSRGVAAVTKLSPMIYPRVFHNSVVLPDGRVMLVGGQTFGQDFQDTDAVMATEIWNPSTRQFSLGATLTAPRTYHSVALLLPDGRVMSGGGGLCGGCSTNHPDFQLYEPSYLFDASGARASRPTIQSAPAALTLGKPAEIVTDREVASFALVRMGATTHTVNADQRRIPVAFTRTGTNAYRLAVTSNSGYLLPGQWMLFALDSAGVPSVAKIVSVAPSTVATLVAPDQATLQFNTSATITPTVIPLGDGVRYSGLGLPAGLTVDSLTGQISGAATESGSFVVSLVATRGGDVVSTDLSIVVEARQTTGGAPTIAAPAAQTTKAGTAVSLAVSASDPDADPLAFSAMGLPPGLAIGASTGVISGTPTTPGSYEPKVTAADPLGLTASASFSWTISGGQPKVVRVRAAPVRAGVSKVYAPEISDGAGATYSWSFGDGSAATPFDASAATSHVFQAPGIYSVVLTLRAAAGTTTTYGFDQAVLSPDASTTGATSSGGSAHQKVGTGLGRLWVVNRDNDSVSAIDLDGRKLTAEIAVGSKPWALVLTTRNEVWVANRESASISVIDASALTVLRTIPLPAGSRPSGLALVGRNSDVAVTLEATGQIMMLGPLGENYGLGDAGPGPRAITVNAARDKAYVSRFVTPPLPGESTATPTAAAAAGGQIRVINLSGAIERTIVLGASDAVDTEVTGRGVPNYLGAMAISPNGKTGWVPSKQDNVFRGSLRDGHNLNFQNTVRAIVSRVNLATGVEDLSSRIDVDNAGVVSAVAVHPNGAYLFAALETTRAVAVLDPVGKRELVRIPVGQAPNALTLLPGNRWLAVHNMMDRSVSLIDLQPLTLYGRRRLVAAPAIRAIGTEKLSSTVLKGKQLFYDAADVRLARDGYVSCASCHDDGEGDGRVWDLTGFGEGLRNTISLQGHGGRAQGFLHWTGNFDEVQDFEKQIRDLAGGTGLMKNATYMAGTRSQPLGARKAGLSADLDALSAYVSSLTATPRSPYVAANGGFTSAGLAGRSTFDRLKCGSCHGGSQYTISDGLSAFRGVGTIKPTSGTRLGKAMTRLDVPTLRGVWATAPYLHDGSAATLEAAIKAHTTLSVSDTDAASLAAFLRELGPQ